MKSKFWLIYEVFFAFMATDSRDWSPIRTFAEDKKELAHVTYGEMVLAGECYHLTFIDPDAEPPAEPENWIAYQLRLRYDLKAPAPEFRFDRDSLNVKEQVA